MASMNGSHWILLVLMVFGLVIYLACYAKR